MGRPYYYFAASLPIIDWDAKPPMSVEDFLAECVRLLSNEDAALIRQTFGDDEELTATGNTVADAWMVFNRNYHNEIAAFRAQRAGRDPHKAVRGAKENDPTLRETILQASKLPNLLEAEKMLDRVSWQYFDELANGHYFDLEYIIIYGLKLKFLERQEEFRSSKGNEMFDGITHMEFPDSCIVDSSTLTGAQT